MKAQIDRLMNGEWAPEKTMEYFSCGWSALVCRDVVFSAASVFDDDSEIKCSRFLAMRSNFDGCERHERLSLRSWQRAAALHGDFKVASLQSDGGDSCQLGAPRFSEVMDEPATLPHLAAVIEASVVVAPQGLCFPGGRHKEEHPAPARSTKFCPDL